MAVSKLADYKILVITIDFGTTFSGYAFAFNDNKRQIFMNKNWGIDQGFQSYKAPTCVLLKNSGEFQAFGYDAEAEYAEDPEEYQLFRHFKMALYRENGDRTKIQNRKIASTTGTQMFAVDVFAKGIAFLKDHALEEVYSRMHSKLDDYMIKWVITVPAIWSDEAKKLMRDSALKAGIINVIDSQDLTIALEPEAAAIYCLENDAYDAMELHIGHKYLIVDCGGGTVDITAYEVTSGSTVKEIFPPSGGPWGGTYVDENFHSLLGDLFGKDTMTKFKKDQSEAWLQCVLKFEMVKKNISQRGIKIEIPSQLQRLIESKFGATMADVINNSGHSGVSVKNYSFLNLSQDVVKGLFEGPISSIKDELHKIMTNENLSRLHYVFLVGGFSECSLVQTAVREVFDSRKECKVLVPSEGQLAIVKGAVEFAFQPNIITRRIARFYYGFDVSREFDAQKHDPRYKQTHNGSDSCHGLFSPVIKKGEVLKFGAVRRHQLGTNKDSQHDGYTELWLYRSAVETDYVYDVYTSSKKCKKLVKLKIDHEFGTNKNNKIDIEIHCGSTELTFKAKDSVKNKWLETSATYD